jgi:hypothetical protein
MPAKTKQDDTKRDAIDPPEADEDEPAGSDDEDEAEAAEHAPASADGQADPTAHAIEGGDAKPKTSRRAVLLGFGVGLITGAAGGAGGMYGWMQRRRRSARDRRPALGRTYVEIAAWNPRRGPSPAKVTIVEFSDFQ